MSDLEDFKLGCKHNAGDPDGLRVVESKNKWAALADRIEALGLPRPIRGEKVMPLFERVVTAFEKARAKYRFQYVGDLHGTPVHLHQDPPTSVEPVAWPMWEGDPFPPSLRNAHPPTQVEPVTSMKLDWTDLRHWPSLNKAVSAGVEKIDLIALAEAINNHTATQVRIAVHNAHPPTSTEPDVMRLVDAYVLLHVDALDDHPIVLEARAAIIAALKTR